MPTKATLELINEYKDQIKEGIHLRVYKSKETGTDENDVFYFWHFGFPSDFIKPLCPLIEASPYWGEQHWAEVDNYLIFRIPVLTHERDEIPMKQLNAYYQRRRDAFLSCVNFISKMKEK